VQLHFLQPAVSPHCVDLLRGVFVLDLNRRRNFPRKLTSSCRTFDTVSTGIALYYLLSLSIGISMFVSSTSLLDGYLNHVFSRMPRLARVLLRDGLLYFIVLTR
jgi:hypothetical protein